MEAFLETALANQRRAHAVIRTIGAETAWRAVGADPHLVGSLRTGLLMKHLDIDFHIYSPELRLSDSFAAVARIAACEGVREIAYVNLLGAPDRCLEWHIRYADAEGSIWQIDMIHMPADAPYAGYFELQSDRIAAALTDETRRAILRLKYETPDDRKIAGIAYYQAVLRDGVRTWPEFETWRLSHPLMGIVEWMPQGIGSGGAVSR